MCIAVICCAMFTACETSPDELSYKNPISFGDRKNIGDAVNALLWGYYGDTWIYGTKTTTDNVTSVTGQNANVTIVDGVDGDVSTLTPKDVPTRYWAQTKSEYNFYAMWPLEGNENDHGISNIKFNTNKTITFDCDITKQTDICIAATLNQTSQWNVSPIDLDPVNLHFQHMLSKVQFIGRSASTEVKIVRASINVPTTATGTYSNSDEDLVSYDLDDDATQLSTPDHFARTIPAATATENTIDITDGGWLVFPGEFTEDIEFTVEYETGEYEADGTTPKTKSIIGYIRTSEETSKISWQRGKRHIYNFTIQPAGPITFGTVTVAKWEDGGTITLGSFPTIP